MYMVCIVLMNSVNQCWSRHMTRTTGLLLGCLTGLLFDRKQKLKVLKGLPDHLHKVLPEDDAARISVLWKVRICTIFTG